MLSLGLSQEYVWKNCFDNLQEYFPLIDYKNRKYGIIIEFKMKNSFLPEEIIEGDIKGAKNYCINRYAGNDNKCYGLMASSKAYNFSSYRMKPQFQPDVAVWFNRAPSETGLCCQLSVTVSEFDCQGLKVDMPIVGWDTDMLWDDTGWFKFKDNEVADSDENTYRINSYRVLLTRGRYGFIAFVPAETNFIYTYKTLKSWYQRT